MSASGCFARAARDEMFSTILSLSCLVRLFLDEPVYQKFEPQVPTERWFRSQRKGLGYEAFLYAMMQLARSDTVLHWGFDESSLDERNANA
jgi:hypothetical protein